MSTSQINSNKLRERARQPGAAQIQQNLTNIGIQKSQSLINFQLSGPSKMTRVNSQHPAPTNAISAQPLRVGSSNLFANKPPQAMAAP